MRFSKPMAGLIQVRVSHDERHLLLAAAARRGLTLSEYIRQTAAEAARRVAA